MKRFQCQCGHQVFFENKSCIACGSVLGFCSDTMDILSLTPTDRGLYLDSNKREYGLCNNGEEFGVCNWLCYSDHPLCFACQFNRTIPNLQISGNLKRWQLLEEGKKRLFFTLMSLGLPLINGWKDTSEGLLFDFISDQDSDLYHKTTVSTGHLNGVITINTLEADEITRAAIKLEMNESYRTVLGHLRHESGHYFWSLKRLDPSIKVEFKQLFGDEHKAYQQALNRHYLSGPPSDWREHYISAYASAHPMEDWAETWGHYLYIYDILDTAAENKIIDRRPIDMDMKTRVSVWRNMSVIFNEFNRSVGLGDAYPFVINRKVEEKLTFVHRVIEHLQTVDQQRGVH